MTKRELLQDLPPFKNDEVVIAGRQTVDDIVREVLASHKFFASDYDLIAGRFVRSTWQAVCQNLFNFCKRSIPYVVETEQLQTSRSPAAVMELGGIIGADCKHYAGFIGGVVDAIGRQTGQPADWCYRFAFYEGAPDEESWHVFVVVRADGKEYWVDPVLDTFNQRVPKPDYFTDKKPSMSLVRISGPGIQTTTTGHRSNVHANTMGDVDATSTLNAVEPGLGTAVQQSLNSLPDGDIKSFLTSFLKDPGKAITTLLKGRTYTIGDYKLLEMFLRNVLGKQDVQTWETAYDNYDHMTPAAWSFFTAAMGVRVRTSDDMDALCGYANTPAQRAQNYLNRIPGQFPDISLAAATRAAYLFGEPFVGGLYSIYTNRNVVWPKSAYLAQPYILPIPDVMVNTLFSGVHPITGETFVNGYPASYTGVRYISQTNSNPQPPSSYTPPGGLPSVASLGGNVGTVLLFVAGGAVVLSLANSKGHGHRRSVGAVSKNKKRGAAVAIALALGLGYFLLKKPAVNSLLTQSTLPAGGGGMQASLPSDPNLNQQPGTITPPTGGPGIQINQQSQASDSGGMVQQLPPVFTPGGYGGGGGGQSIDPYTISDVLQPTIY